jgi:hypothetical protein
MSGTERDHVGTSTTVAWRAVSRPEGTRERRRPLHPILISGSSSRVAYRRRRDAVRGVRRSRSRPAPGDDGSAVGAHVPWYGQRQIF